MIKNSYTLVTGVDGYSGSTIKKLLEKSKINLIGVSRRYSKNKILQWNLIKKNKKKINYKIDCIIHTAAIHKIKDFSNKLKNKNKNKNILMTKNLIEFAKEKGIKNFIFFSTIDLSHGKFTGIKKNYNLSKLKSEQIISQAYKKNIFEKAVILRIPAIVGKNANENFLINSIKKLEFDKDILIEDRQKYNNFVHINDLYKLVLKIIIFCKAKKNKKSRFLCKINCLSSNSIHISKKILKIKRYLNSNSKISIIKNNDRLKFLKPKTNKFNFKFMSCNKAIQLMLK